MSKHKLDKEIQDNLYDPAAIKYVISKAVDHLFEKGKNTLKKIKAKVKAKKTKTTERSHDPAPKNPWMDFVKAHSDMRTDKGLLDLKAISKLYHEERADDPHRLIESPEEGGREVPEATDHYHAHIKVYDPQETSEAAKYAKARLKGVVGYIPSKFEKARLDYETGLITKRAYEDAYRQHQIEVAKQHAREDVLRHYREQAGKKRQRMIYDPENGHIDPKVLTWIEKKPRGSIMRPETFKKIIETAKKKGYSNPQAVAGRAYWKTAIAKYKEHLSRLRPRSYDKEARHKLAMLRKNRSKYLEHASKEQYRDEIRDLKRRIRAGKQTKSTHHRSFLHDPAPAGQHQSIASEDQRRAMFAEIDRRAGQARYRRLMKRNPITRRFDPDPSTKSFATWAHSNKITQWARAMLKGIRKSSDVKSPEKIVTTIWSRLSPTKQAQIRQEEAKGKPFRYDLPLPEDYATHGTGTLRLVKPFKLVEAQVNVSKEDLDEIKRSGITKTMRRNDGTLAQVSRCKSKEGNTNIFIDEK
jgi:hypothetical protein